MEREWKIASAGQVHDMVDRRAAFKLSKDPIHDWKEPVWCASDLIAPDPLFHDPNETCVEQQPEVQRFESEGPADEQSRHPQPEACSPP